MLRDGHVIHQHGAKGRTLDLRCVHELTSGSGSITFFNAVIMRF